MEIDCASCEDCTCHDGTDCYDAADAIRRLYEKADPRAADVSRVAAEVEAEGYMQWPRALEIIRFAEKSGFEHLGVAFCIGLAEEARLFVDMLEKRFRVSSICCKAGGIDKGEFGMPPLRPDEPHETMCSPLGQAELLNEAGTQLNVVIGLCVGHDSLFYKHSAAPVTTLVVKDRVLAHNPVGALYSGYWRRKLAE
jgi:uncharacterized metal-binding protein